jgi:hypothetical protein
MELEKTGFLNNSHLVISNSDKSDPKISKNARDTFNKLTYRFDLFKETTYQSLSYLRNRLTRVRIN